ncbi:MAG: phosphate ABC transporter permease PstA [Bacteroidetes bacterium]|nr:phosphate ABC transporter permease PstA [Bacteroidota bacterium]
MNQASKKFFKKGDPYVLLTSLGLLISLGMVLWLLAIVLVKGLGIFWPRELVQINLKGENVYLGELWNSGKEISENEFEQIVEEEKTQLKIGNRDLYGYDFIWISDKEIKTMTKPQNAAVFERSEYGNLYGFILQVNLNNEIVTDSSELFNEAEKGISLAHELKIKLDEIEEEYNTLLTPLNKIQREISLLKVNSDFLTDEEAKRLNLLKEEENKLTESINQPRIVLEEKISTLKERLNSFTVNVITANGDETLMQLKNVVRLYQPNEMGIFGKSIHYVQNLWEFLSGEPRESNTEGGVFPAIFGTVMMVILMSILVVPFGVLAAVYLNEYAKQGALTRIIRLSVNNLAGVPSIVFGIFGLGFFIYIVGGSIDQFFFSDKLPAPTFGTGGILWASLTLALLTLPVVVVATEEGILAVPKANKDGALALGATKWQMIKKVVLPNAMPGILTGLILAISRGAGEVAPLMITGVVKLAPDMPLDFNFPFFHLDRKFMHLGFHIYDVGFQSPNVEAAIPMVYSTALLLIAIVVFLNLLAIYLRNRLRKKYKSSSF